MFGTLVYKFQVDPQHASCAFFSCTTCIQPQDGMTDTFLPGSSCLIGGPKPRTSIIGVLLCNNAKQRGSLGFLHVTHCFYDL